MWPRGFRVLVIRTVVEAVGAESGRDTGGTGRTGKPCTSSTVYEGYTLVMAQTTTVKVQITTRTRLKEIGAATRRTADEVILAGLAALERERWQQLRLRATEQAAALVDDEADLAEARAIEADLAEFRAW